jgi:hypothetical protein
MTGEHRPGCNRESQSTEACRVDLTRGEIGVGAVLGASPLTEAPGARAGSLLRRELVWLST